MQSRPGTSSNQPSPSRLHTPDRLGLRPADVRFVACRAGGGCRTSAAEAGRVHRPRAARLHIDRSAFAGFRFPPEGLADHPVTRLLLAPMPGSCDPQWQRWARRWRSGCPSRSNARTRAADCRSRVPTRASPGDPAQPRRPPHPQDLRRLVAAVRLAWQIAHPPEIARHTQRVALLSEKTVDSDDALAHTSARRSRPSSSSAARSGWARRAMQWPGRPALPDTRRPEPSGGRCIGHAHHPPREHQPHLHHDR